MEKIIEKLYQLHLEEMQYSFGYVDREKMEKEYDAYCKLSQTLPAFMKGLLMEFSNLNEERRKAELQAAYEYGFKTAIKLILEATKEWIR